MVRKQYIYALHTTVGLGTRRPLSIFSFRRFFCCGRFRPTDSCVNFPSGGLRRRVHKIRETGPFCDFHNSAVASSSFGGCCRRFGRSLIFFHEKLDDEKGTRNPATMRCRQWCEMTCLSSTKICAIVLIAKDGR